MGVLSDSGYREHGVVEAEMLWGGLTWWVKGDARNPEEKQKQKAAFTFCI